MSPVNGIPDDHIPLHVVALLDRARRRYRSELADILPTWQAKLSDDLREVATALSGSHYRLLAHIPPDGARVTDIAELADITKQSTGELLSALAKWNLVETVPQDSDRRIRLTRRTPLGDDLNRAVNGLVAAVERRWRRAVGRADYETMRRTLQAIVNT
jgi:DNA-binding MarR family transcriptional regulator